MSPASNFVMAGQPRVGGSTLAPGADLRRACRGTARWSATVWSGPIRSARSLVMSPASTVSTQTFSSVSANSHDVRRVVELAAVVEAARPGEDRGDRVGRGRLALLVLAVVARHRAVRGLGLDRLAVGRQQHRGHQAERAEALRHRCRTARRRRSSCRPRRSRRSTSARSATMSSIRRCS